MNQKKRRKRWIPCVAVLIILFSSYQICLYHWENTEAMKQNEALRQLARPEAETEEIRESDIDFNALQALNPEVIGWIRIPDTEIDYPVLQASDNHYYETHNAEKQRSAHGAIFLDAEAKQDFSDPIHILYGHNMKDGSMFKGITYFKDPEYFQEHRTFFLDTPVQSREYQMIACWVDQAESIYELIEQYQNAPEDLERILNEKCSDTVSLPEEFQYICILATCSYEADHMRTYLLGVF